MSNKKKSRTKPVEQKTEDQEQQEDWVTAPELEPVTSKGPVAKRRVPLRETASDLPEDLELNGPSDEAPEEGFINWNNGEESPEEEIPTVEPEVIFGPPIDTERKKRDRLNKVIGAIGLLLIFSLSSCICLLIGYMLGSL
jgi:hypothetical protein